jgi:hypothetical protein
MLHPSHGVARAADDGICDWRMIMALNNSLNQLTIFQSALFQALYSALS